MQQTFMAMDLRMKMMQIDLQIAQDNISMIWELIFNMRRHYDLRVGRRDRYIR